MKTQKRILTVMIPCYNEERGIGKVIDKIPKKKLNALGYEVDVMVIDNNSKDRTSEIALKKGARVIFEKRQGKGHAVFTGFRNLLPETDKVVMLDGDNSYDSREMLRLVEPLDSNFCDVVIGTRLAGKIRHKALSEFNRMGNWFFTFLVRLWYHGNVTDVCTGYFAWKRHVVDELSKHLESKGFAIEMEMIAKMAQMGFDIFSVPITYGLDAGKTSLNPIKDGYRILSAWGRYLLWTPYKSRRKARKERHTHYSKMRAGVY